MTEPGGDALLWDLAQPWLTRDDTEEGTIMSSRCLRVDGDFWAMTDKHGRLVVKLPAERVTELVDEGAGEPFAPAGKVFREWVAIVGDDEATWEQTLDESHRFARGEVSR